MQESEFDKQVQQELGELRLRPSAAVWENVEKELRRKKRRRVIVAFWLLTGIALLGFSGYLLTQREDNAIAHSSSPSINKGGDQSASKENAPNSAIAIPGAQTDKGNNTNNKPDEDPGSTASETTQPDVASGQPERADTLQNQNGKQRTGSTKQTPAQEVNNDLSSTGFNKRVTRSSGGKTKRPASEPEVAKDKSRKESSRSKDAGEPQKDGNNNASALPQKDVSSPVTGSGDETTKTLTAEDSSGEKTDTAIAKTEEKEKVKPQAPAVKKAFSSKKIKWSLDLAAGASGPISSPFLLGGNNAEKALMQDLNAAPVQGGIWSPPGTFGPVHISRSDIKPGPSARVGISAELPLSERFSVSTGLQYQYQSNNIRIGFYKDTTLVFNNYASQQISVNAVYQGSQQKTFTNRYHFLQVPFNFHWQMNNTTKKLPVILNAGLTAGYLITSNGLLYDSLQGGTYYHDSKAFNRFQLNFNTGVSFRFGNKKALQWSIGPEFSMGLRRMIKEEYDKKQYPLFIGIQGRIYLPGRKR